MSCNCNKAFSVPVGAAGLNLGVYKPNAPLFVIFETATGRRDVYTTTCTSTGSIQLPTPGLRLNTPYTVTLCEQTDPEQADQPWQVNSTLVNCLSLQFEQMWTGDTLFNPAVFDITLKP